MLNPKSLRRIIYIPFDHLNLSHGAMRYANKDEDLIVLVESQRMVDPSVFSPQRLFFLLSSARHFRLELEKAGFNTRYIKAPTTVEGIKEIQRNLKGCRFLPRFSPLSDYKPPSNQSELNSARTISSSPKEHYFGSGPRVRRVS